MSAYLNNAFILAFNFIGSGSHSPFPMHVKVSGPLRVLPVGQAEVTLLPLNAGSLKPMTLTEICV